LVHRDFMPRNLMPLADGDGAVLDFQDAVRGPIAYDALSLFKDAFWSWPSERVDAWLVATTRARSMPVCRCDIARTLPSRCRLDRRAAASEE
jgi:aminoglycoside/choline kinase family phosphotransferase